MEYIIGIIVGGIITGIAMILNSYFNTRFTRQKEQREYRRTQRDKYILELESIYQETIHILDKMIRDKGRASEDEIEKFYRLGIQLNLKSNTKINNGFSNLRNEIAIMAKSLPSLPEEFIPKFEDDDERRYRLEERKKAEKKRDEEAKKYADKLYKIYFELSNDMKNHLVELRNIDSGETRKLSGLEFPEKLRRTEIYRVILAFYYLCFLFVYSASLYANQGHTVHIYGALGVLAAIWATLQFLAIPEIKWMQKLRKMVDAANSFKPMNWNISVLVFIVGLVINLASIAGKDLPSGYFIFFYVFSCIVVILLILERRFLK